MELTAVKANPHQDIGLALLGVGTTFGIWSSLNTSPVGMVAFGSENEPVARAGMNLAVILVEGVAVGIYMVYGSGGKVAAIATGLSGAALWLFYDYLLKKGTSPPILSPVASGPAQPAQPTQPVQQAQTAFEKPAMLVSGR